MAKSNVSVGRRPPRTTTAEALHAPENIWLTPPTLVGHFDVKLKEAEVGSVFYRELKEDQLKLVLRFGCDDDNFAITPNFMTLDNDKKKARFRLTCRHAHPESLIDRIRGSRPVLLEAAAVGGNCRLMSYEDVVETLRRTRNTTTTRLALLIGEADDERSTKWTKKAK